MAATLIVLIGCALFILPVAGKALGFRTIIVAGGSMEPVAGVGDVFMLRPAGDGVFARGDIITFRPLTSSHLTTHRVLRAVMVGGVRHYQTQGDANETPDADLVPAANVIGSVVLHLPAVGRYYNFASTPTGRAALVVVPAVLILFGEIRSLRPRRPRRRRLRLSPSFGVAPVVLGVVMAMASPAFGIFTEPTSVGANDFAASHVDAPSLDSAQPDALLCQVTLVWTAPATGLGPDGYDVYRSTTGGGPYSFVKHVGVVTTTNDSGLSANTTYYYVLRSTRDGWVSGNSNERSATTGVVCV
jgi:signal peptidase